MGNNDAEQLLVLPIGMARTETKRAERVGITMGMGQRKRQVRKIKEMIDVPKKNDIWKIGIFCMFYYYFSFSIQVHLHLIMNLSSVLLHLSSYDVLKIEN